MKTSIDGMIAILKSEAVVLSTYSDAIGVKTIGVGHTASAGQPHPMPGLKLTLRQALQLFMGDLEKFERGVLHAIDKVPLLQHEFDGFVSFHFNTGQVERGTVDDKWESGDKAGAMKTLLSYRKANGRVLEGLVERRKEEKAIIERGAYPAVSHILVADGWRGGKPVGKRLVPVEEIKAVLLELRKSAAPVAPAAPPAKPSEPASIDVETPADPHAGKAATGGIAGGLVAGAAASANGFPWPYILLGAGVVACLLFIAIIIAKRSKA